MRSHSGVELLSVDSCRARAVELLLRLGHVIVADVESTGFVTESNRLVEVAVAEYAGDSMTSTFATVVKGTLEARSLPNAVPPEEISTAPAFRKVAKIVKEMVESADLLISQNARFDARWLEAEFRRVGEKITLPPVLDLIAVARKALPGMESYALDSLVAATGVKMSGPRHRALVDVMIEHEVFLRLVTELVRKGTVVSTADILAFAVKGKATPKETTEDPREAEAAIADFVDEVGEMVSAREAISEAIVAAEKALADRAVEAGVTKIDGREFFATVHGYDLFDPLSRDESVEEAIRNVLQKAGVLEIVSEISRRRLAKAIEAGEIPAPVLAVLSEYGQLRHVERVRLFLQR